MWEKELSWLFLTWEAPGAAGSSALSSCRCHSAPQRGPGHCCIFLTLHSWNNNPPLLPNPICWPRQPPLTSVKSTSRQPGTEKMGGKNGMDGDGFLRGVLRWWAEGWEAEVDLWIFSSLIRSGISPGKGETQQRAGELEKGWQGQPQQAPVRERRKRLRHLGELGRKCPSQRRALCIYRLF